MSYFKKQYIKYDEDVKTKLISVAASDMLKLSDLIELYEVSRDELILNDIIDIAELDEEH